ncbi:DUF2513 domain-containing protein [Marinobacter litoralis]|uniref:DUF2513 domain-containing protein n=1 Tax=Marinobacter litoralis TaxID=187981 RepID=UPI0018ED6293|nr:DUF2513 domain-containing protein [Marinobacter litoralis]MBJ6137037.1 DUF2513 domain-containing protein [Marinobacter litoralis]
MERNWDTIREILGEVEKLPPDSSLSLKDFDEGRAHEVSYQVVLLAEAGLVDASLSKSIGTGPTHFVLRRLTWSGHDFLDAIRDEKLWHKTKVRIAEHGGAMTYELVKTVAVSLAKSALGI